MIMAFDIRVRSMRLAHSKWLLVITLIACLAAPDVILDWVDDHWDFNGPGDPRTDPVAAFWHPSTPPTRPGDYHRPLWHHPPLRPSTQAPHFRVLLARLGSGGGLRKVLWRNLYLPRSGSAARTPHSLFDPARTI